MPKYSVSFARAARKELESLPDLIVSKIFPRIESLAQNPRPSGCKKLKGTKNLWRLRVGDYRVLYSVSDPDGAVDVIAVRHRSIAYD
jgi:mRNA interferase RelE/StbE